MEYRCEDLPQHGVVLLPPSAPEFPLLFTNILHRQENPLPGSPPALHKIPDPATYPTMILLNRSQLAIAAVGWVWKFETANGQTRSSARLFMIVPSVLAPFGLNQTNRKLYAYWDLILPGSKRLISEYQMFGDNSDVRPPQPDELWKGGGGAFGGGRPHDLRLLKSASLYLDGVFFMDGSFAGPDIYHNFETAQADLAAYRKVAQTALAGRASGLSVDEIFAQIELITGPGQGPPPPPPPPTPIPLNLERLRQDSLRHLAVRIYMLRRLGPNDDQALDQLASWAEITLPTLHKL